MKMLTLVLLIFNVIALVLGGDYSYCEAPTPMAVAPNPVTSKLLQVFVISRHGDRSPNMVVPGEFNDTRIHWNCTLRAPMRSLTSDKTLNSATGSYFMYAANGEGIFGDDSGWHGNCQVGQLTSEGGEMCTRMGAGMRQIYVDKYHLLPERLTPDNVNDLYLRSTDIQRTRESLASVLEGLYPADTRNGVYVPVVVFPQSSDYIFPNSDKCERIYQLMMNNIQSNQEWKKSYLSVKDILDKINAIAGTKGDSGFDDNYTVMGWTEVLRARMCHNLPFPCTPDGKTCVTQDMADAIIKVGDYESANLYVGEELVRLASAPIFADIAKFFSSRVSSGSGPKYIHYSAHDTSIAPVVSAYTDVHDQPPYASSVRIELWQTSDGSNPQYAVQTIYNNKVLRAPECGSDMCPLDKYLNMISSRLTIHDVKKECAKQKQ